MGVRTGYRIGTLGTVVAAAYLAIASNPFFPQSAYAENRKGLESAVQNVLHGIKDGKYKADVTVVVRNKGSDISEKLSWFYSLCFDTPAEGGKKRFQCIDGKAETLNGLKHGREVKRSTTLKMRLGLKLEYRLGGKMKTMCIRGQKPNIKVRLSGKKPIYEKSHYLTPVGDYK